MHSVIKVLTENGWWITLDHKAASESVTIIIEPPNASPHSLIMGRSDWRAFAAEVTEFERQREAGFPESLRHEGAV